MYFISEHSTAGEHAYGTLIGTHDGYIYSGNSYENGLYIRRRKTFDTREWETIFYVCINSWSSCTCTDTIAAAYGIIGNELYVAGYGKMQNEETPQLFVKSFNLRTQHVIDYANAPADFTTFGFSLCNQCCMSSIVATNPMNDTEIAIVPNGPEDVLRDGFDVYTSKFTINRLTAICKLEQTISFQMMELGNQQMNQSNVVHMGFGKILYFNDDNLIIAGQRDQKQIIEITHDSDLKKCASAGFYRNTEGLYCMAFEETTSINHHTYNIYRVNVDVERLKATFTKVVTIPHHLLPSDPRFSKFVMDSRMIVWSYQQQNISYVFGLTTLAEAAYVSASNSSSQLHHEYEILKMMMEQFQVGNRAGIHREAESLGLSQSELKEMLGLPESLIFLGL